MVILVAVVLTVNTGAADGTEWEENGLSPMIGCHM